MKKSSDDNTISLQSLLIDDPVGKDKSPTPVQQLDDKVNETSPSPEPREPEVQE